MSDRVPTLRFGDQDDESVSVDLPKLIASRMLIQANSGGGKSWALRYMLEQTHGQVQQLVLDSEGEFASLRERFPYILAGTDGDLPATPKSSKLLCRRLVELGASAVLDIYDLSMQDRRRFVRLFLDELMHLPKKMWRPLLVVIDEAHRYAPETGKSESAEVVQALCSQGRKRGFCAVLVTQRLSKLSKDAAAELLNKLIGRTHLDVDVRRAADDLGFDKEQRQKLKELRPGEFFVYGPAIGREVTLVRTGDVDTTHPEPGVVAPAPPPPPDAVQKLMGQLEDLEEEAAEEERTVEDLRAKVQRLERELAAATKDSPEPDPEDLERAREAGRAEGRGEAEEAIAAHEVRATALLRALDAASTALSNAKHAAGSGLAEAKAAIEADEAPSMDDMPEGPVRRSRPERGASARASRRGRGGRRRRAAASSQGSKADIDSPADRDALSKAQRRILDALATYESFGLHEVERPAVGAAAGYSAKGGYFTNTVSSLHTSGLLEYPSDGYLSLTASGRALSNGDHFDSLQELHDRWLELAKGGAQRKILDTLIAYYPSPLTREELAEETGYEAGGGYFTNMVSALRTLGAVEYPAQGEVRAADLLFPEGLR